MTVSEPSRETKPCIHCHKPAVWCGVSWIHEDSQDTNQCPNGGADVERAEPSRGAPEATHTPGPWHVDNTPGDTVLEFVYDANGRGVAGTDRDRPDAENQANARLIAQAPTLLTENERLRTGHVVLLEALRAIRDEWLTHARQWKMNELILRAEAAIKQAERT